MPISQNEMDYGIENQTTVLLASLRLYIYVNFLDSIAIGL